MLKKFVVLLLLLAPSVLAQNPTSGGPIPQTTYQTLPNNLGVPNGTTVSGSDVTFPGSALFRGGNPWVDLRTVARGDANLLASCTFTASSWNVTCSGSTFTVADVNKIGLLYGSAANGSGATATTTLSGNAITTPSVTGAGSGYLTPPATTITGLTCTYNPEIKAVLSGSNYATGNTLSSITVVYAGSGCTGTPAIVITSGPNLDLPVKIQSVTDATHIVLTNTSSIQPSVSDTQPFLYGTDDTTAINNAIQTLAPDTDKALNPISIRCDRIFLVSSTVNFINKAFNIVSPGPGSLTSIGRSNLGCGFMLLNQTFTNAAETDVVYIAGSQLSTFNQVHLYATSGNMQRSAIQLQQAASQVHNTAWTRFNDNLIGHWFLNEPNTNCLSAQCAEFNYGIWFNTPAANNDQMMFTNNIIADTNIAVYQFANQSTNLIFDHLIVEGDAIGVKVNTHLICRDCFMGPISDAAFVLGDNAQTSNADIALTLDAFTAESVHQFIRAENNAGTYQNEVNLFLHSKIFFDTGAWTIKSGALVDLTNTKLTGNVVGDSWITVSGTYPATTVPPNYIFDDPAGNYGTNFKMTIASPSDAAPASSFTGIASAYPDARSSEIFSRDWYLGGNSSGQFCHTNEVLFGGGPDSPECNSMTAPGKMRVIGQLLVTQLGQVTASGSKLSGTGAQSYFYKISALAAGVEALPSAEVTIASQNASLSASAVNQVCAVPLTGAQQYKIYESTTTGAEKLLATVNADAMLFAGANLSCYNDSVGGAAGASPPTADATGGATFAGPLGVTTFPQGSAAAPSIKFNEASGNGFYSIANGIVGITASGAQVAAFGANFLRMSAAFPIGWSPSTGDAAANDIAFSREGAGIVDVGNGTQGDVTGTIKPGKYATGTNCSSSASPAVCGSAAAGSVAVPTGVTPTLVVNTTAVTANSQILFTPDESLGTKLSVTCNSTIAQVAIEPIVTARTAATSFTIQYNTTITVNPICLSYWIIN